MFCATEIFCLVSNRVYSLTTHLQKLQGYENFASQDMTTIELFLLIHCVGHIC